VPWQECYKVDERLRFVARLLEGERMAGLWNVTHDGRQVGRGHPFADSDVVELHK